ncbi:MAG: type II methionyl aminopeptidase [Candidatus Aenigmatarchaeota archaeon]
MLEKDVLEKYEKAGKMAAAARDFGAKLIREGALAVDIAEAVEKKIADLGGKPAFQVTVNINDVAAHYAPVLDDRLAIKAADYVKLDVGVHIGGYIADTAVTVRPAGKDDLIICSEKMLETAIKMFVPGAVIEDVAAAVEDIAKGYGFRPVSNLTGHMIGRWTVHAGVNVPSVRCAAPKVLSEGEVYGIEPFVTAGKGFVKDSPPPTIFRWIRDVPQRDPVARKILAASAEDWQKLPFAKRWAQQKFGNVDVALSALVKSGALYHYNTLKEISGKPVAQAEHTVMVADKPVVLTL